MRIHSVTMKGFGPYRDEVVVDVDAFDDDGIFLLAGRTGAGKSSVLDALTYGLFGTVPRYGGRVDAEVRSRYLADGEPTEVTVEFTVGDTRYRVWRSPSFARPKKVGDGFTTQAPRIELGRYVGGELQVFETKIGNADTRVSELVGLDAQQFLQVVLLAQGQFQEFLVARSEERRRLLRTLFRTRRFDDYAVAVQERAKAAQAGLDRVLTTIEAKVGTLAQQTGTGSPGTAPETVGPWITGLLTTLTDTAAEAGTDAEKADAELTAALAALESARATAHRQARRSEAEQRRTQLLAEHDVTEQRRGQVAAARRAALAQQAVSAHTAATEALIAAHRRRGSAARLLAELRADAPDDDAALRTLADDLADAVGGLAAAAEQERRLPELRRRAEAAQAVVTKLDASTSVQRDELETVRHRRDTATAELEELGDPGARHAVAEAATTRLRERLAAARRAADTGALLTTAEAEHLAASEAAHAAEGVVLDLRARQLAGWSAVVARELETGAPCPVCGSMEHPSPATPSDDHVEESDLDAASDRLAALREVEQGADRRVQALRAAVEAAATEADGSTEQLAAALGDAEAALADATAAVTTRAALQAELTTLRSRATELETALASADDRRRSALEAATATRTDSESAEAAVGEARGEAASVQDRRARLQTQLEAVRALVVATDTSSQRAEAVHATALALDRAVEEHGFASPEDVTAAVVEPREIESLDALVAAHDQALAVAESTLAEPELDGLPRDPIDLEPLRLAHDQAKAVAADATRQHATASRAVASATALADEITSAIASSAAQLARLDTVRELDLALRGYGSNQLRMPLETFALVAELEDILGAANARLATMTHGRYQLLHSDDAASRGTSGLELVVLDAHSGTERSPSSLSGGEKFQASLALALGLAEVVTSRAGGLRLDTLFIDEGFGSLDPETLEVTMETLDSLREGGRTIGLISHVEAMKESIPAQVRIETTPGGWSTISSAG
jgi:exonuclease SbcC